MFETLNAVFAGHEMLWHCKSADRLGQVTCGFLAMFEVQPALKSGVCAQAADINALFGFRLECIERMGDQQGLWAWQRLNSLFNWLPLAALIEDRIICMHGGAQYRILQA